MSTTQLKERRTAPKIISRKQAADACKISQFALDKIERDADVDGDLVKAYTEGLGKLLADAKKQPATNGMPKPPAKKATARKATQPKTEEAAA
jgi:hypothetical protein